MSQLLLEVGIYLTNQYNEIRFLGKVERYFCKKNLVKSKFQVKTQAPSLCF